MVSLPRNAFRGALAASAAVVAATAAAITLPASSALAADTATVNAGQTYQTIAGFGASEAFGQASSVMNSSSSIQQQVLSDLYSPTTGAGPDHLAQRDQRGPWITIEPNNPGGPNATPSYLPLSSINSDQGQLWFAQQIKADYGVTNVFADAWSAPGFMKTNGAIANGGQVCGSTGASCSSGDWRQAYANYLVQYAKDYAAAGVPLSYIGPSNEPDFSADYDSMTMSPAQMASLLDVVGPTVKNSGLSTQVECCAATGWPVSGQYASAIKSDPTALADTAMLTSHGYSGAPTSPISGWAKPAWETEWSTFETWDPAWDDGSDASGMTWAQHIYQGLTGANLSAFLYWWGSTSGTGDNESLVQINGSSVQTSGRLWAFANYSRFIRPGAVRISATSSNSGVDISAFKNTDGSVAIVVLNNNSSSDTVNYSMSGTGSSGTVTPYLTNGSGNVAQQSAITLSNGSFGATIPARSLVTYVVGSTGGGSGGGGSGGGGSGGGGRRRRTGGGEIHALGSGKCLDVSNNSTAPGTQLDIWDCNGGSNQIWTRSSSNQLTVYSGSSQLCLDAYGNETTAGTKVDDLDVQRRREPAVERQRQRHHHRRPVRAVPGRDRRQHRRRRAGRVVDLQRRLQPAMGPRMRKASPTMTVRPPFRRSRRALLITGAAGALAAGALVTGLASGPASAAPILRHG